MSKLHLLAYPVVVAVSLAASFAAHAEAPSVDVRADTVAVNKTRADVRAETLKARADGSLQTWAERNMPVLNQASQRSRAEVRAEAIAAAHSAADTEAVLQIAGSARTK